MGPGTRGDARRAQRAPRGPGEARSRRAACRGRRRPRCRARGPARGREPSRVGSLTAGHVHTTCTRAERGSATPRRAGRRRGPWARAAAPWACPASLCTAGRAQAAMRVRRGLHGRGPMEGHPGAGARERRRERERAGLARRGGGGAHRAGAGDREEAGWPLRGRQLHARGGRAEGGRERHTRCAQWQVGVQARRGASETPACASGAGWIARVCGQAGGVRAPICSRGLPPRAPAVETPPLT